MALEAPLRSSTGNMSFHFAQANDMSSSPEGRHDKSPGPRVVSSPPAPVDHSSLRPASAARIYSNPATSIMSPSDLVGPSPVTSNGTETTEIEDDASDEVHAQAAADYGHSPRADLRSITTSLPDDVRMVTSEESTSVIHAPKGFESWTAASSETARPNSDSRRSSRQSSPKTDATSPPAANTSTQPSRPSISTDVKPTRYSLDSATPRAQELHSIFDDTSRLRSSSTSSLDKIEEQTENEAEYDDDDYTETFHGTNHSSEVLTLKTALRECWSFCKTLANMSSLHRSRVFNSSGTPDAHEKAWETCWKLCKQLYDAQDRPNNFLSVGENLDYCRNFCQALFDIRLRTDEVADSVLRVSFELNNHLYALSNSDSVPEEVRERTLDFYITLCHRLMKQRGEMRDETDPSLRACWSLTEMLFSLRQNTRNGKQLDIEILEAAVQACWDLCNIFRDGWSQDRPDRSTPRASQTSFSPRQTDMMTSGTSETGRQSRNSQRSSFSKRGSVRSSRESDERPRKQPQPQAVPETPVTEFEDTPISPESRSPNMPNIMVLGTSSDSGRGRWSSSASNLSSYSQSSARTSSTATTTAMTEDPNVHRSKVLILRAAMDRGFGRHQIGDSKNGSAALREFVQGMPPNSFGSLPGQTALFQQYRNSVLTDGIIPRNHKLPSRGKRVSAVEMAKSVQIMVQSSPRYAYLSELYMMVFEFSIEEAETYRNRMLSV